MKIRKNMFLVIDENMRLCLYIFIKGKESLTCKFKNSSSFLLFFLQKIKNLILTCIYCNSRIIKIQTEKESVNRSTDRHMHVMFCRLLAWFSLLQNHCNQNLKRQTKYIKLSTEQNRLKMILNINDNFFSLFTKL